MKHRLIELMLMSLIFTCFGVQAFQQKLKARLPDFEYFVQLPAEIQINIFEKYLNQATTIPELYDLVTIWKQVDKVIFKGLAESSIGVRDILEKEKSIIKLLQKKITDAGFENYANLLNSYFASIKLEKLVAQEADKDSALKIAKESYKNKRNLQDKLTIILVHLAYYEGTFSLIEQLIENGADVNGTELGMRQKIGNAALCKAVLGMANRIHDVFTGKSALPNFEGELNKLRLLVSNNADPKELCDGEPLIKKLKDSLNVYRGQGHNAQLFQAFKKYIDDAEKILNSKKGFFWFRKK